jgi:hypothetical protein
VGGDPDPARSPLSLSYCRLDSTQLEEPPGWDECEGNGEELQKRG